MRAAVHASDIDGIASAALLLMKYPNIEIDFLTLRDIKTKKEYDFVVDLPKLENGKINIDHHKTNYEKLLRDGQLSQKDLVDPNAPSAAQLLIKYLSLENNSRAIEIASMANDSDQGKYDEKLYLLDKIIKCKSGDPETLYKIAELLIRRGRKFTKDEFFKHELNQLIAVIKKGRKFARKIAAYLRKQKVKVAVLDVISGFPRITMSDLAWEFIANRGSIIVVINRLKEPEKLCKNKSSGNFSHIHISIRVSKKVDFKANIFAEKIGGGGHEKAAGARIPIRKYYYILGKIIEELSLYQKPVSYFRIDENMLSKL